MYELVLSFDLLVVPHDRGEIRQPHGASEIREEFLWPETEIGQPARPHAPVERLRLHVLLLRGRIPVPAAGRQHVLGELDAEPSELLRRAGVLGVLLQPLLEGLHLVVEVLRLYEARVSPVSPVSSFAHFCSSLLCLSMKAEASLRALENAGSWSNV